MALFTVKRGLESNMPAIKQDGVIYFTTDTQKLYFDYGASRFCINPYSATDIDNKISAVTSSIIWKEAVDSFEDIATTYDEPEAGWTVNVKDTNYTYRYDGEEWLLYSENVIPIATSSLDGLMSAEYVQQLMIALSELEATNLEIQGVKEDLLNVSIDPDDLGLFQDSDTSMVYPTYKGVASENGIMLVGGSGGGGGGGGGDAIAAVFSASKITPWNAKTISTGSALSVQLTWSSVENDEPTGAGTMTIKVNDILRSTRSINQGDVTIDLAEFLNTGTNKLKIRIADAYDQGQTFIFTVTCVDLTISSTFDTSTPFDGAISFPYTPVGAVQKTVYFILDGQRYATYETSVSNRQLTQAINVRQHGAHSLLVYFEATIDQETVTSNELYFEFTWLQPGNITPSITSSFHTAHVSQYDSVVIPYMVYSPSSATTDIELQVNGTTVSELTVNRQQQTYTFRANTAGENTFTIIAGTVTKDITFIVDELDIDVAAETENLVLYLSAQGRSNSEATKDTWTFRRINCQFTDFNWVLDGWHKDSDGIDLLRLVGDARLTIPYQIFGEDFKTTGKTIEIEFATRDVTDYNSTILQCFSDNMGLKITSQSVLFAGAQTQISTLYKDNEHLRLTITVDKQNENRLILIYINGIMSRAIQYASGERFSQMNPVNITIGSNDCGIDVYAIRVYDNNLTREQVLDNWIADTQIAQVMLQRYAHNDVYDEYGEVGISKLPGDLPYMIINAEELPQYKGDKKTVTGSYTDPVDPSKSFTFEGCSINVQGTSSAPYYRKNYDMQFKSGFQTSSGTQSTYALRTGHIPFNRFVLKADVASSESTNNTRLTMFYNDTCPYKTPEMLVDDRVRWGIEGYPIVLYWYDTVNRTTQFMGKYNFNLPKRMPEPLGYSGNMQSWEWQRNNSDNVKFKDNDFTTMAWNEDEQAFYPAWYDDFEARMPSDEWRDYAQLYEMITWVKSTARDQCTNETLPEPVTYRINSVTTLTQYGDDLSYTDIEEEENGQKTGYHIITFTKDTPAYRLTKFRAELPDYFEVDSALYYYLFTEMFLMIDSRAKNMFIGFRGSYLNDPNRAMDRKAVLEPYDMDTAIGTNNSGVLMFGYYHEDTDTVSNIISGGDSGGSNAPVFNAQDSILWVNVRDAFRPEITTMYRNLRSAGTWSYDAVESMYEAHQAKWPEAIFNEDAYIKYIVPLVEPVTVDEDTGQLIRTDRYLTMLQGSKAEQRKWWLYNRFKYMDSKFLAGTANTNVISARLFNDGTLTVTPAADCYVNVRFGGGTSQMTQRTTANTPVSFVYSAPSGVTEMETYVYSADLISDIGDMSGFYPNELDLSRATKLKRLKLGDSSPTYSNANLQTFDVRNSTLLESIDCRNCPNLAITVNLENSPRLVEAYFDNTAITGIDIADGSPVEVLHLPSTITTLTLLNLTKLQEFEIPSYANISRLMMSNIDTTIVDPVEILEQIRPNSQVNIQGLYLDLPDSEAIQEFLDLLDTMSGVTRERGQNGEWLYHDYPTAQVTGTIHTATLTGSEIARYNETYPYINFIADTVTAILTYKTYNGAETVYTETILNGGDGTYINNIPRAADARYSYTPNGWSRMIDGTPDVNATKTVYADRTVYAAYDAEGQKYTVYFRNDDNTLLQTVTNVLYGRSATYTGETPIKPNVEDPEMYEFSGWSPSNQVITGSTTCIAQYTDLHSPLLTYLTATIPEYTSPTNDRVANYGMYYRRQLKTATAPLGTLGYQAFQNCYELETVDFTYPTSINLGSYAFANCYKLKSVILRSDVMATPSSNSFDASPIVSNRGAIYVPADMVAQYKADYRWSDLVIFPIDSYPVTDPEEYQTIHDSWSQIFDAEENGTYSTLYHVGDTKFLMVGSKQIMMQIVAMDTDLLSDNSGTAKITWLSKECINPGVYLITRGEEHDGWLGTTIRTYLQDEFIPLLDPAVASNIKSVKKYYTSCLTGEEIYSNDLVWIPSSYELCGARNNEADSQGVTYKNFLGDYNTSFNKRKRWMDRNDTSAVYWPYRAFGDYSSGSTTYIGLVGESGNTNVSSSGDNSRRNIVFGFCT